MKKRNFLIVLLLLSIVTIVLAVSVAIFRYVGNGTTNNVIETGRIVFSYSDAEPGNNSNPIKITDALPMKDEEGKVLSGTNQYFDFSVSASTTSVDLAYEITVLKLDNSTMDEDTVKIYLTDLTSGKEEETEITGGVVPTYKELKDTSNSLMEGKSIYFGTVKAGEVAYGKNFRLRMWIKDVLTTGEEEQTSAIDETVREFTVKVNVSAIGNN